MSRYTEPQKLDIALTFERNKKSIVLTQRELQRRLGIRHDKNTIKSIHKNLMEHRRLTLERSGPQLTARTTPNICRIRELANEHEGRNQPTSTRRLALEMAAESLNVSRMTVYRVLNDEEFRGYHERHVHELKPEDYPRRVEIAQALLRWMMIRLFMKKS